MALVKRVHVGKIEFNGNKTCEPIIKGKQSAVVYELNNWLFDYFYSHSLPIRQLPPLDDWTRSPEHPDYWSIKFPDEHWMVTLSTEMVEF